MSTQGQTTLSIVLVSWNTRDMLGRCMRSIRDHSRLGSRVRFIVVDNASGDGSVEMVRSEFPATRVIANEKNLGFAVACNQGMRMADGELILLLNSDTYVTDDVIDRSVAYMDRRLDVDMMSCQLRYPDGRLQHSAFRSLGIARSLFADLWLHRVVGERLRQDILLDGYWDCSSEKEVDWLAGAFMLLRRSTFLQSGGFDEDFFMYGEDSEWCMRLRRAGRRIVYAPLGIVYHVGSVSSDLTWGQRDRLRLCHLGGFVAYDKINGKWMGLAYRAARLFGSACRWAAYSLALLFVDDPYYEAQREGYGWQIGFCLEALGRPPKATAA